MLKSFIKVHVFWVGITKIFLQKYAQYCEGIRIKHYIQNRIFENNKIACFFSIKKYIFCVADN